MNDNNNTYWTDDPELVEKYVLGQLTDEERLRLDAEIADSEPSKQKLRHELEMAAGIRRYGRDSLKTKLHSKLRKKQSTQIQQFQFVGLAAAVVIIAIGIGVYQIWFSDLVAPKKFGKREIVFKQAEQPHDTTQTKIESRQAETEKSLAEATEGKHDVNESDSKGGTGEAPEELAGSSSKDITEIKSTRSDKDSRAKTGSGELKKKKTTAPSKLAMHDEVSTLKESAGAPSVKPSAPAGAISSSEVKRVESKPSRVYTEQTIWLIGKVEMISSMSMQNATKVAPRKLQSEQFIAKEEGDERRTAQQSNRQSRTVTVKRSGEDEQIVLQQRSFRELPLKRQTQLGKESHVETLLEQSKTGSLSLTIFSDALTEDDIESATVETVSDDSLIIATANQRIYYRLPEGLSAPQRSRR